MQVLRGLPSVDALLTGEAGQALVAAQPALDGDATDRTGDGTVTEIGGAPDSDAPAPAAAPAATPAARP